jgi:hypothetical protein
VDGAADADDRTGQGGPRLPAEHPDRDHDALRGDWERGYDPDEVFAEMAADNKKIDQLELVLDSDPRNTTQAGLPRVQQPPAAPADGKGSKDDGEGDDGPSKPENPPDDDDDDEDEDE